MKQTHKWSKEIIAWLNSEEVVGRRGSSGAWQAVPPDDFRYFNDPDCQFRIVPKTININGHEVSEPLREAPEYGTTYFYSCPNLSALYGSYYWSGSEYDFRQLKTGFAHLTREAAIAHAEALLSFTSEGK